jgi:hypothetical protein
MGPIMSDDSAKLEEQLRRLAAGDQHALADLFARYRDRLRRMVKLCLDHRLQSRVDASDVLQEAYLDVMKRSAEYAAQRQRGGRTVDQLQDELEVHPDDAYGKGTSLPRSVGCEGIPKGASPETPRQGARAAQAALDTASGERHDLPACPGSGSLKSYFYSC